MTDIAATGQDYTLDSELMEPCRHIIEPQPEAFRSAGALSPRWRSRPTPARRPGCSRCSQNRCCGSAVRSCSVVGRAVAQRTRGRRG